MALPVGRRVVEEWEPVDRMGARERKVDFFVFFRFLCIKYATVDDITKLHFGSKKLYIILIFRCYTKRV